MPLYEYACEACGHRFEEIQTLSEAPLTVCEKCNGKVERLLSSPAIQFKGSGWYVTDYAKKGAPPDSKGAEKGSDKTSEKTTDPSAAAASASSPSKPSGGASKESKE